MDVVEVRVAQVAGVVASHAPRQRLHADFLPFLDDAAERLLLPAIERDVRGHLRDTSEAHAIGVFAINQGTGEPTLIQTAETHGIVPRTFSLDASARILVAANQNRLEIKDGQSVSVLMPCLSLFRVLANGKLDYVRKYDVETTGNTSLFWMGIVPLPR